MEFERAYIALANEEAYLILQRSVEMDLEEMQGMVEGYIELTPSNIDQAYAMEDGVQIMMVVNEEGKLEGLPYNELATRFHKYGDIDQIVGNALIVGVKGENIIALKREAVENMMEALDMPDWLREV